MTRHSIWAGAALASSLLCPLTARASDLDLGAVKRYTGGPSGHTSQQQQVSSIEALLTLVERYGCVAGNPNGGFQGSQPLSRYEAAALLQACLDRVTDLSDDLQRLRKEFATELAVLQGRTDGLEAKLGELGATQFSTTTRLDGMAVFVIGANAFHGSARQDVNAARGLEGSTSFNVNLELNLDTSFKGNDLLRTVLRAGNFARSAFGNGGLNELEVAFQQDCGNNTDGSPIDCSDVLAVDKFFYQFPIGNHFTATVGGRVGQEDMLAVWPSVYPSDTILNLFSFNGAPAAYNKNLGTGAGLWWKSDAWSLSANYVAAVGDLGNPGVGGIGNPNSQASGSAQLAYAKDNWAIAGLYSVLRQNTEVPGSTPFAAGDWLGTGPGHVNAFALSGYWQPSQGGWFPSLSLGWGYNSYAYNQSVPTGSLKTSQSWSVALQWDKAFLAGNVLGFALGQPVFATGLTGGASPNDGNYAFELWYKVQATDHISVTPAIFYLSRPEGQDTPGGKTFNNFGAILKTTFKL